MTGPIVVVATGSSAAMLLPHYLVKIRARFDDDLTVVPTASALRFVSAEVLGWFATSVVRPDEPGVNPIEVALNARAIAVLPASGNMVAVAALGLMPTTAATIIGASPRPCLFMPQMNAAVWRKPIIASHIAALRTCGHTVVDPELSVGYEISLGKSVEGLSMPGPEKASEILANWMTNSAT